MPRQGQVQARYCSCSRALERALRFHSSTTTMRPMDTALLAAAGSVPPLSPAQAHTLSLVFTSGYVGSIYLSNLFARADKVSAIKREAVEAEAGQCRV
jgi:hypothetical protein